MLRSSAGLRPIGQEFEAYGYRRICAELRDEGLVVNSKKVRRLMREHDVGARRPRTSLIKAEEPEAAVQK